MGMDGEGGGAGFECLVFLYFLLYLLSSVSISVNKKQRNLDILTIGSKMQQNSTQSVHELTEALSTPNPPIPAQDSPTAPDTETNPIRKRTSSIKKTIKIKVQQCRKSNQLKNSPKQCRICLEGEEEGRMIRPCLCSGSVTFVHEKCITEWIKRKHEPKNSKAKLACQMCNTPFVYKFGKRRKLEMEQFCNNYQKQKCNFLLFYIFVSVLFLVILGLIFIIAQSSTDTQLGQKIKTVLVKSENIKIIYICVVFLLCIVLMFLLILFLIQYAVKSEVVITEVLSYTQVGVKKRSRIHPKGCEEAGGNGNGRARTQQIQ